MLNLILLIAHTKYCRSYRGQTYFSYWYFRRLHATVMRPRLSKWKLFVKKARKYKFLTTDWMSIDFEQGLKPFVSLKKCLLMSNARDGLRLVCFYYKVCSSSDLYRVQTELRAFGAVDSSLNQRGFAEKVHSTRYRSKKKNRAIASFYLGSVH